MASAGIPLALILSMTAVIASVFIRCASCAVRARLSAAIPTHARSGACFTTPSPVVTMTGGPGDGACCANPEDMERSQILAESASVFITSPTANCYPQTSNYAEHAARKPMPYEYVSGGTLWR